MPKEVATIRNDRDALVQVCGGEEMADRATKLWDDIKTKNRLDVSDQKLSDDDVKCLIKGLHMVAKTQDETYANERTKPFPLTELDFSGNQITGAGIGDVVQFARTQGCDATLVDLSKNLLDDDAALNELTRLVKNYGTFGSQNFLRELLLSSNNIGKAGATKLVQYAHWERERHAEAGRPTLKLDLSDNCVTDPEELVEELKSKRIRVCSGAEIEPEATVHLPDFADQRAPAAEVSKASQGRAAADKARGAPREAQSWTSRPSVRGEPRRGELTRGDRGAARGGADRGGDRKDERKDERKKSPERRRDDRRDERKDDRRDDRKDDRRGSDRDRSRSRDRGRRDDRKDDRKDDRRDDRNRLPVRRSPRRDDRKDDRRDDRKDDRRDDRKEDRRDDRKDDRRDDRKDDRKRSPRRDDRERDRRERSRDRRPDSERDRRESERDRRDSERDRRDSERDRRDSADERRQERNRDDSPKAKKKPNQEEAAVDDDAEDDAVLQAMDAEEGGELMAE